MPSELRREPSLSANTTPPRTHGGGQKERRRVTIQEAIEAYILGLQARDLSARTIDRYTRTLTFFQRFLSSKGVTEYRAAKAEHLRAFQVERRKVLSNVALHHETAPLKAWSRWLETNEYAAVDPFRKVNKPKLAQTQKIIPTPAQIKRVIESYDPSNADDFRDLCAIKLFVSTGVRRTELLSILADDVDLQERKVYIRGKGRKDRFVALNPELMRMLHRYITTLRGRYHPKSGHLFISRRGAGLEPSAFGKRFAERVRLANIPVRCTLHTLRHFYATATLGQGASIELVSRSMGHSDSRITSQVYSHVSFADVANMHREFDPLKLVG